MKKLYGRTTSIGVKKNNIDFTWYTFQNGDIIPAKFEEAVISKGGKLVDFVEEKEEVKKSIPDVLPHKDFKKTTKSKTKRKSKK